MWYGWRDGCRKGESAVEAWDGLEAGGLVPNCEGGIRNLQHILHELITVSAL